MNGQACDPSRLIEILDAPNVDECNETIVEHLEECKSCQRELERMAAGDWWRSVGKQLLAAVEIDPDDSGSQVIAICDESAVQSSSFKSWSVDLLEPPSHPELLG